MLRGDLSPKQALTSSTHAFTGAGPHSQKELPLPFLHLTFYPSFDALLQHWPESLTSRWVCKARSGL